MTPPRVVRHPHEQEILAALLRAVPGYTPDWVPAEQTAAHALLRLLSRYLQVLAEGTNQVPERSVLAFLETLGGNRLPAQAARAPLVFRLLESSPVDVSLQEGTRVAARPQPVVPTPNGGVPLSSGDPLIFASTRAITLTRARLVGIYSLDPGRDAYANHSGQLESGFTLFENLESTGHVLYLGHDHLFNLAGDITILLIFSLDEGATRGLELRWEYHSVAGWLPLESDPYEDTSGGLGTSGQLALRRACGPNAARATYLGRTSYWLRGRVNTPLPPQGVGEENRLPRVNDIRVRLDFSDTGLLPEAAFADGLPLDVSKDFYPFGQQPLPFATFYLANREVFQRPGARVALHVALSRRGAPFGPMSLAWEYHDGSSWRRLGVEFGPDGTDSFLFAEDGTVAFHCPRDWAETEVNGNVNYWLRVRIAAGSFGQPPRLNDGPDVGIIGIDQTDRTVIEVDSNQGFFGGERVTLTAGTLSHKTEVVAPQVPNRLVLKSAVPQGQDFAGGTLSRDRGSNGEPLLLPATLRPPVVERLALAYSYLTDPEALEHCVAYNDFVYTDHTADAIWPDRTFTPFRPVADRHPAVYCAFDRALPVGLVSLYVDVPQTVATSTVEGTPFAWEYRTAHGWAELSVVDETLGFQRSGMLQFIGPPDAVATPGPPGWDGEQAGEHVRLRARLNVGERLPTFLPARVWLNAVWAEQRRTHVGEPLGSSDGGPGQSFSLAYRPALVGEQIEVQEWRGSGESWRLALQDAPEQDRRLERDPATSEPRAVWVTWRARTHLFASGPLDRHYVVDRGPGLVRFGDGRYGRIPPAGNPIQATYHSGGGLAGNVGAGEIGELHSAVPYVQEAWNPVHAAGGSESEPAADILVREPQRLRHGGRGVSASDVEWLARQATPDVARARCLSLVGPAGHGQRGWLTVVVVPRSLDARPRPTSELLRAVHDYLAAGVPASASGRIRVVGPRYLSVEVQAEIVPWLPQDAAQTEANVRRRLDHFLHPLAGGPEGQGWEFGQSVHLSHVASLIEATPGVDRVRRVRLVGDGQIVNELLPVDADALVAPGRHELKLTIGRT